MTWFADLFKKELLEIKHDMRRPAFLFGAALAYLIVFGMLYPSIYEVEHPEEECAYKTWQIMFVKTVVYWLLGMLSYVLVVAVVIHGLEIPLGAPLLQLLALASIFILAVTAFCFFFTSFFPAELPFVRAVILYPVPSFIFSGYTWPTESMGEGMQFVSQFFPLSHFSNTVRELFLIGQSPHYWESIEKLTALAIGFFLIGGVLYHRRLKISRRTVETV